MAEPNNEFSEIELKIPNAIPFEELQFSFNPESFEIGLNVKTIRIVTNFNDIEYEKVSIGMLTRMVLGWYLAHVARGGDRNADIEMFMEYRKQLEQYQTLNTNH